MTMQSIAKVTGVIFIVLGALSIIYPFYSSLGIEAFFGAIFLFGGIFQLFGAFEEKEHRHYLWNFIIGALFIVTGVYLLAQPLAGLLTLTMVLMALFFAQGILTVIAGFQQRAVTSRWIWTVISGLLTIGIAAILLASYPLSALWALGVLVGVNFLLTGFSFLCVSGCPFKGTPK